MNWGKLSENGYLIRPGKTITLPDGRRMNNFSEEAIEEVGYTLVQTMEFNGFKPLIETEQPEEEEGFYYTSEWKENEESIEKVWIKHEQPSYPDPVVPEDSEIDQILMGVYDE